MVNGEKNKTFKINALRMARVLLKSLQEVINYDGGAMGKRIFLRGIITGLVVLLFTGSLAMAAVAPEVTRLLSFQTVSFPGGMAFDSQGNIYLGDTRDRLVRVYNHKGILLNTIKLDFKPMTIGVSPAGVLYVGGRNRIDLYSGSILMNSYKGIVEMPSAIAFLNGKSYVADGYWVKILDSTMNKIGEFGGYAGSDDVQRDGKFNGLRSIAVDTVNSQIYCLDSGAIAQESGYTTYVWRVQVFDENGNFIRSFSNYGYGIEGKVGAASSIAVDREARVYVADSAQNIIVVYDSFGAYLKTIYDNTNPIYNPVRLDFNNNRLYVASSLARSVYIFAIDLYALLRVEPSGIELSANTGNTVSASLNIYNDGTGELNFNSSSSSTWLSLSPSSGIVPGGASGTVTIFMNTSGMTPGTYSGTIQIASNGGTETIPVTLHVTSPPVLTVTPTSFNIIKKKGSPADPLLVDITLSNDSSGSITWSATSDSSLLRIIPETGPSNSTTTANIMVDTNLNPGTYTGHITVRADGAEGSPATITVNLEIKTSRKLAVTTNTDLASFTITGPATFEGSGSIYEVEDPPPGTYTITFKPVRGHKTPEPQYGSLSENGELLFTAQYQPLTPPVIIASHGPGLKDNMDIRVFNGDGTLIKTIPAVKDYQYGATVATGDVDGDGVEEIIIGTGPGAKIPAEIMVLRQDGEPLGEFRPFIGTGYGVEVSAADLDGDGTMEIIAGKTRKFARRLGVDLKVFKYNNGLFNDTGIRLRHRGANGIRLTPLDTDADGLPEILVVPARGNAPVHVYKITPGDPWTAQKINRFPGCPGAGGSNITAGDTGGDGTKEIILACSYEAGTMIRILDTQGNLIMEFPTGSALKDYVASGDLDGDGRDEIIVGDGPSAHKTKVKIFNSSGGSLGSFDAFEDSFGARISTGRIE